MAAKKKPPTKTVSDPTARGRSKVTLDVTDADAVMSMPSTARNVSVVPSPSRGKGYTNPGVEVADNVIGSGVVHPDGGSKSSGSSKYDSTPLLNPERIVTEQVLDDNGEPVLDAKGKAKYRNAKTPTGKNRLTVDRTSLEKMKEGYQTRRDWEQTPEGQEVLSDKAFSSRLGQLVQRDSDGNPTMSRRELYHRTGVNRDVDNLQPDAVRHLPGMGHPEAFARPATLEEQTPEKRLHDDVWLAEQGVTREDLVREQSNLLDMAHFTALDSGSAHGHEARHWYNASDYRGQPSRIHSLIQTATGEDLSTQDLNRVAVATAITSPQTAWAVKNPDPRNIRDYPNAEAGLRAVELAQQGVPKDEVSHYRPDFEKIEPEIEKIRDQYTRDTGNASVPKAHVVSELNNMMESSPEFRNKIESGEARIPAVLKDDLTYASMRGFLRQATSVVSDNIHHNTPMARAKDAPSSQKVGPFTTGLLSQSLPERGTPTMEESEALADLSALPKDMVGRVPLAPPTRRSLEATAAGVVDVHSSPASVGSHLSSSQDPSTWAFPDRRTASASGESEREFALKSQGGKHAIGTDVFRRVGAEISPEGSIGANSTTIQAPAWTAQRWRSRQFGRASSLVGSPREDMVHIAQEESPMESHYAIESTAHSINNLVMSDRQPTFPDKPLPHVPYTPVTREAPVSQYMLGNRPLIDTRTYTSAPYDVTPQVATSRSNEAFNDPTQAYAIRSQKAVDFAGHAQQQQALDSRHGSGWNVDLQGSLERGRPLTDADVVTSRNRDQRSLF